MSSQRTPYIPPANYYPPYLRIYLCPIVLLARTSCDDVLLAFSIFSFIHSLFRPPILRWFLFLFIFFRLLRLSCLWRGTGTFRLYRHTICSIHTRVGSIVVLLFDWSNAMLAHEYRCEGAGGGDRVRDETRGQRVRSNDIIGAKLSTVACISFSYLQFLRKHQYYARLCCIDVDWCRFRRCCLSRRRPCQCAHYSSTRSFVLFNFI